MTWTGYLHTFTLFGHFTLHPNHPAKVTHVTPSSSSSHKIMASSGLIYLWCIRSENGALYPKRQGQANSPCCSSMSVAWSVVTSFEVWSLFLETYRKNQGLKKPTWILRLRIAVAHRFRTGELKSYPSLTCSLTSGSSSEGGAASSDSASLVDSCSRLKAKQGSVRTLRPSFF